MQHSKVLFGGQGLINARLLGVCTMKSLKTGLRKRPRGAERICTEGRAPGLGTGIPCEDSRGFKESLSAGIKVVSSLRAGGPIFGKVSEGGVPGGAVGTKEGGSGSPCNTPRCCLEAKEP